MVQGPLQVPARRNASARDRARDGSRGLNIIIIMFSGLSAGVATARATHRNLPALTHDVQLVLSSVNGASAARFAAPAADLRGWHIRHPARSISVELLALWRSTTTGPATISSRRLLWRAAGLQRIKWPVSVSAGRPAPVAAVVSTQCGWCHQCQLRRSQEIGELGFAPRYDVTLTLFDLLQGQSPKQPPNRLSSGLDTGSPSAAAGSVAFASEPTRFGTNSLYGSGGIRLVTSSSSSAMILTPPTAHLELDQRLSDSSSNLVPTSKVNR